ncbi:MAG TPA: GH1 family beta-glucosidase [Limnochordales bacterium]
MRRFPEGFLWGCATASYQIEGSPLADGASPSIWHRFSHTPGNVHGGDTGDVACDHYRRWRDDVALMRELGLKAYRFSIAWPRVLPDGTGRVNEAGVAFYDRLVDALLEAGIVPFVTLYHWDLPGALQDRGGWANRDVVGWFAEYAGVMFERLGDRVRHWITLNEPWCVAHLGYVAGVHAPGMRDLWAGLRAAHHLLLAHGEAVAAFRASKAAGGKIGITLNLGPQHAATESEADRAAADRSDAYHNRLFLDPLFKGRYPDVLVRHFGGAWPEVTDEDLAIIRRPIDFLGVNYYSRGVVADAPGEGLLGIRGVDTGGPRTAMGWEIYPEGLYELLVRLHREYGGLPLYITENGAAFDDRLDASGEVDDGERLDYLRRHFLQARRAIDDGVRLEGYFVWSLMDNFEWALGYSKRFGIVYVDYPTQRRIVKRSGRWYRQVIEANGVPEGSEG